MFAKASFVKTTRKNKAKNPIIGETFSFYMCATKKKGHSPCSSGTIRETILEEECSKVLETEVFDPEIFLAKVKQITIPETGTMIFEMNSGQTIEHHWYRNARKDCWTQEARKEIAEYRRRNPSPNKKGTSCFTSKIRCGCCGWNYRRQAKTNAVGERSATWYCATQKLRKAECHMPGIDEDLLKGICAKALGLDSFDEDIFTEEVDHITMTDIGKFTIYLKNGKTHDCTYSANQARKPFTEERRKKHSEIMRKYWRERNGD